MSKITLPKGKITDVQAEDIAKAIEVEFDKDPSVHERAVESEYYRSIMYDLVEDAEKIDGTPKYWKIVRYVESLWTNSDPVRDWND